VRTGVTAIHPRGKRANDPVFAGWFALNGNGEMTGTTWVEESGFMEGPLMITNTHSVGVVRDAVIAWQVEHNLMHQRFSLPVVAETFDGGLNDVNGFHVKHEHALAALENAASGPVAEGNVGGGTGMRCYQFKGGIGTSSRKLTADRGGYTVGVLVQANFGRRDQLRIAGAPVGARQRRESPLRCPHETVAATILRASPFHRESARLLLQNNVNVPPPGHWALSPNLRAAQSPAGRGGTAGGAGGVGNGSSGNGAGGGAISGGSGGGGTVADTPPKGVCVDGVDIEGGFVRCADGMVHRPAPGVCSSPLPRPDGLSDAVLAGARGPGRHRRRRRASATPGCAWG
jgi:hypothetical protein